MKRFLSLALLAAALAVLVMPQDVSARGEKRCGAVYAPVYYSPYHAYYTPYHYYAAPRYVQPARPVVEVSAIDKRGFDPKTITVAPGTTVRWVNRGQERHTVTSRDGKFDSGPMAPGAEFNVTFVTPGTYEYFCKPHEKMGMVGTVVVGRPMAAEEKADKNTHTGTFVQAIGASEFAMEDKGKEHSHTLSADARVIGPDGKEIKLADLKKGQRIRVTTKEGDMKIATRVEAVRGN
jgi:plastocyanin